MSVFGTAVVYGTGYVYGPSSFAFLDDGSIELRGPIEGGTNVNMLGVTPDTSGDDDFAGVVIDPLKWVASAAGSGSVVQNDELQLRTGTVPNSSAVLTSVPTFGLQSDVKVDWRVATDVIASPPAATTRLFDAELYVDVNNYLRVSRIFDTTIPSRHAFRITCVVGGTVVDDVFVLDQSIGGTLRIVRIRNHVIVYLNSTVLYDDDPFLSATTAQLVFRAVNPSLVDPYDFTTVLDNFRVGALVLLDGIPAELLLLGETLRFSTPAMTTPRDSTISVYVRSGLVAQLSGAFEYFLASEFKMLDGDGASIGVVGDATLRNLPSGRLGFEV